MFINIDTVSLYKEEILKNDLSIFNTNININKIENIIHALLDKHEDTCKYYFNISENYWSVSFNVGMNQIDEMCKSTFQMDLYKDNNNNAIIALSNEINEYQQWSDVLRDLRKKLKSAN
jgi:hypothetical protein